MRWKDPEVEQSRDLGYKIEKARPAITQALAFSHRRAAVAFSGEKDSTVVLHVVHCAL